MPLATRSDEDCVRCGSGEVWQFTKAGEDTLRLECDDCGCEWSQPGGA